MMQKYKTVGSVNSSEPVGKKFSEKLKPALKLTLAVSAICLLAGCGSSTTFGDGAGSGDVVPTNDGTTPLTDLFGRVIFPHSFFNSEAVYTYDATFGEDDLALDGDNELVLVDTVAGALRETADSDFMSTGPETMTCGYLSNASIFLCSAISDNGMTLLSFGRLVNDTSSGDFTFCQAGISGADCASELINSPDGFVNVVKDTQLAARGTDLNELDAAKNSPNNTSIQPYYTYHDQASTNTQRSSLISPENLALLTAELEKRIAR